MCNVSHSLDRKDSRRRVLFVEPLTVRPCLGFGWVQSELSDGSASPPSGPMGFNVGKWVSEGREEGRGAAALCEGRQVQRQSGVCLRAPHCSALCLHSVRRVSCELSTSQFLHLFADAGILCSLLTMASSRSSIIAIHICPAALSSLHLAQDEAVASDNTGASGNQVRASSCSVSSL